MQPISGTDVSALRMVMTAAGLWLMMTWTLGLAAMPRFVQQFLTSPRRWLLLPLLGGLSAVSMSLNMKSGLLLPVNLFGMLSYVEPALLFLLAVLVLKTPVQPSAYITYGLIWTGLLLLVANGWRSMQQSRHKQV